MDDKPRKGLYEIYDENPAGADQLVFGRTTYPDRRGFLKGAGLTTMVALVGGAIPFHRSMPAAFIPVALAQDLDLAIEGKDGLRYLNDRPINAETPPHLLDDDVTPTSRHFIRNNGLPPTSMSADGWTLTVDGEVGSPMTLSIDELRSRFEVVTLRLALECGGNGRAFFEPPAKGNQWTYGAVACSEWTGVRCADVLQAAGVKPAAVYTAHYGADTHLSGEPGKLPISRGVPMTKAMDRSNLVAFAMNGGPIHPMNGGPLRLVIPGWPGSCSQKWLVRVQVRDQVHDGPKMTGTSYRVPRYPVAPGTKVPKEDFEIIESMPVKSLITAPQTGATVAAGQAVEVRGQTWAGDRTVKSLQVSIDFGATWMEAELSAPPNSHAWQRWKANVTLPQAGYYEVWARATDDAGVSQPFAIAWNPKGYLNNSMHRIALNAA